MNRKALDELKDNKRGLVTLGGWGGYIVVGFDHTITNVAGQRDFRVLGNAFYSSSNKEAFEAGSCEPGIIMVAYDANHNGRPDEDEWYEIAGSAHVDPTQEPWYAFLKSHAPQADLNCYRDFEMTYYRPANEPASNEVWSTYIRWQDNKGNSGYKVKNQFHAQPYFPQWVKGDKLTFRGTRLPQNGYNQSSESPYYVLYKFRYGYADNAPSDSKDATIDIDWAVDKQGRKVHHDGEPDTHRVVTEDVGQQTAEGTLDALELFPIVNALSNQARHVRPPRFRSPRSETRRSRGTPRPLPSARRGCPVP